MKNPGELKKFLSFQFNECGALKEYLEEMALKGWKLKYFRTYFYFERIEPQKLYYSVDIFPEASVYDTVPALKTEEFIDYCREAGWDFICNMGLVNIFVSSFEKPIPIQTDENIKLKTITKGMLKQNKISWFFLFPVFILNFFVNFWNFKFWTTTYLVYCLLDICIIVRRIFFFLQGGR